ncbi:MAG: hypothetical protein NVS9B11_12500 [Candidatus Dormibacteraceae bacterium]
MTGPGVRGFAGCSCGGIMLPMDTVSTYLEAATRRNTRRSYGSALRHFEVQWGGFLPATADSVARYLADYAESLSLNTLEQRLVSSCINKRT